MSQQNQPPSIWQTLLKDLKREVKRTAGRFINPVTQWRKAALRMWIVMSIAIYVAIYAMTVHQGGEMTFRNSVSLLTLAPLLGAPITYAALYVVWGIRETIRDMRGNPKPGNPEETKGTVQQEPGDKQ